MVKGWGEGGPLRRATRVCGNYCYRHEVGNEMVGNLVG